MAIAPGSLAENGEFIFYQIAPTDGSQAIEGQWHLQDNHVVEIQFPQNPVHDYTLTILECDNQVLKVRETP